MTLFAAAMAVAIAGSVFGDFLVKSAVSPAEAEPKNSQASGCTSVRESPIRRRFPPARILTMIAGILLLTCHFAGFLVAMKIAAVSLVVPLMSCTYVLTTILARIALREPVSRERWLGIGIIVFGIVLLGFSG